MSTIRVARRRKFTQVDRTATDDERISLRALGLLLWLLAKPDDWTIDSTAIARTVKEGRDAIRTAMRELEDAGYLVRTRYQDPVSKQWRVDTLVYECPPEPETDSQASGSQAPDSQAPGSQAISTKDEDQLLKNPLTPVQSEAEQRTPTAPVELDLETRALGLAAARAAKERLRGGKQPLRAVVEAAAL